VPVEIVRDQPLSWRQVAAVAEGARLELSDAARLRAVRTHIPHYRDDRPLAKDIERARELIRGPIAVDGEPEIEVEFERAVRPKSRRRLNNPS
jgi:histidine ammonia-lyase